MFGFFKRRTEVEEETDHVSQKDLEAAVFIQKKSQVGEMFAKRLSDPEEDYEAQRRHYESVRDDLLGWLDTIEDEFSRSFAAHQLIDMCMVGNDEPIARALLAGVRDESIREKIFESSPALKVNKITTGYGLLALEPIESGREVEDAQDEAVFSGGQLAHASVRFGSGHWPRAKTFERPNARYHH